MLNKVHAFLAQKVLILSTFRGLNVATLSTIFIIQQCIANLATVADSSELFKIITKLNGIITLAKRVVLMISTLGILDTDAQTIRNPTSEAGFAAVNNIIEADAGES